MKLLALSVYDPAILASLVTTAAPAYQALDQVNIAATFVVPSEGLVVVRLCVQGAPVNNGGALLWAVAEGGVNVSREAKIAGDVGAQDRVKVYTRDWLVSGLIPGSVHTYYPVAAHEGPFLNPWYMRWGGGANGVGPATLEVWGGDPPGGGIRGEPGGGRW